MNRKNVFLMSSAHTASFTRAGIAGIGVALILALAGCPQPSGGGGGSKTVPVTGVAIHADGAAVNSYILWATAAAGQPNSVQLSAVFEPANASNKNVTWSAAAASGNYADVISLSNTGLVTAVSGITAQKIVTVTVTSNDGNKTAACEITVLPAGTSVVPVTSVSITINGNAAGATYSLAAETEVPIAAVIAPSDATDQTVTWTSSAPDKAKVEDGKLKALAAGTGITITVSSNNSKTATVTVTVTPPVVVPVDSVSISINGTAAGGTFSMEAASTLPISAAVNPGTANQNVTWTSSAPAIATVETGQLKALAAGEAVITVTTLGLKADNETPATASVTLTVNAASHDAVTGLTVSPDTLTFTEGGAAQTITFSVTPAGANQAVSWESDNPSVAAVSGGVVTPVGAGTATITARTVGLTAGGSAATKTIAVTVNAQEVTLGLDKTELAFYTGAGGWAKPATSTITATVNPTTAAVSWESNNPSVATVSGGVVTPVGAGTATIKATAGGAEASVNVTVTALGMVVYNQKAASSLNVATTTVWPSARHSDDRFVIVNKELSETTGDGLNAIVVAGTDGNADGVKNSTVVHLNMPEDAATAFTIQARVRIADIYAASPNAETGVWMGSLAPSTSWNGASVPGNFTTENEAVRFAAFRMAADGSKRYHGSRTSDNSSAALSPAHNADVDKRYREFVIKLERQVSGNYPHIATVYDLTGSSIGTATYNNTALNPALKGTVFPGFVIAGVQAEISEIEIREGSTLIYQSNATPVSAAPVPVSSITLGLQSETAVPGAEGSGIDHTAAYTNSLSYTMTAATAPADATAPSIIWSKESDAGNIASITEAGVISFTAYSEHPVTVKARVNQTVPVVEKTFTFNIYDGNSVAATEVTITSSPANTHHVKNGQQLALSASVRLSNGSSETDVTWKLTNSNSYDDAAAVTIASIAADGTVSTTGFGTVYAWATSTTTTTVYSDAWEIVIPHAASVTINSGDTVVHEAAKNSTLQLNAVVAPSAFPDGASAAAKAALVSQDVTWKLNASADTYADATNVSATASIATDGLVTISTANGTVYAWASSANGESGSVESASWKIEVPYVTAVAIDSTPSGRNTVQVEGELQLTATTTPAGGSVSWRLNNSASDATDATDVSGIATIDTDGKVSGVAAGTVYAWATSTDGESGDVVSAGYAITVESAPTYTWTAVNLGPNNTGAVSSSNGGTLTITSPGKFEGNNQSARLVYTSFTGNFTIIAKVDSHTGSSTGNQGQAGVIMCTDPTATTTNFLHVLVGINGNSNAFYNSRKLVTGDSSRGNVTAGGTSTEYWLKLVRTDTSISISGSKDGTTWGTATSYTIATASGTVSAGFVVNSAHTSNLATAVFSNVSIDNGNTGTFTTITDFGLGGE